MLVEILRDLRVGLAASALFASSAAAAILPLEDHREVRSDGYGGLAVHVPNPAFSDFNRRTTTGVEGYLIQNSRISALSMQGVTTADTYGGGVDISSTFEIVFAVDQPHSYSLRGTLTSGWEYGMFDTPENRAAVLSRGDAELFSTHARTFVKQGALVPGETYRLLVWAKGRGSFATVGWSFDFELPEPRAAELIAPMLLLLARLRSWNARARR
jgi:hypothetical protein